MARWCAAKSVHSHLTALDWQENHFSSLLQLDHTYSTVLDPQVCSHDVDVAWHPNTRSAAKLHHPKLLQYLKLLILRIAGQSAEPIVFILTLYSWQKLRLQIPRPFLLVFGAFQIFLSQIPNLITCGWCRLLLPLCLLDTHSLVLA